MNQQGNPGSPHTPPAMDRPVVDRAGFGAPNDSLWADNLRALPDLPAENSPPGSCDVAIIGGGLTGLWTAYYLSQLDPRLTISVFEANRVAHGASGRAGGWVMGALDGQAHLMSRLDPALRPTAARIVADSVAEVGRVVSVEDIACGFHHGGLVRIAARHPRQVKTLQAYAAAIAQEGGQDETVEILDPARTAAIAAVRRPLGAVTYPHCATVDPARLTHGLARIVIRRGVRLHQGCRVIRIEPGRIETNQGTISCRIVVPAVEAYAGTLSSTRERIIPIYSHIIATAPLTPVMLASLGLRNREAFSDCSAISTYGQITEDGRVVFGGLSDLPFGGRLDRYTPADFARRHRFLHRVLVDLFPQLTDAPITHAWSGVLGIPRFFRPAIVRDAMRGLVWGGGYVGRGLAASNLFGRTIADLVLERTTELTRMPWVVPDGAVDKGFRRWEPEPLRWIATRALLTPAVALECTLMSRTLPKCARTLIAAGLAALPTLKR